jgi:hypothetical protein
MAIVYNIERSSKWKKELRVISYPTFIGCVVTANIIHAQLLKIRAKLVNELTLQNFRLFETQKHIFNSMIQGIILIDPEEEHLVQFMNDELRAKLIIDLQSFPKYKQKLDDYILKKGSSVDFILDPEAFEFLKLEMYVRKQDNQVKKYDETNNKTICENIENQTENEKSLSFYDLIDTIQKFPNTIR